MARQVLGIVKWCLILAAIALVALVAFRGFDVFDKVWGGIKWPFSSVSQAGRSLAGRGDAQVKYEIPTSGEAKKKAIDDLALMAAYDSLEEPAGEKRQRAMAEIIKVNLRIKRSEGVEIPQILQSAITWLPPGWDAKANAPLMWRDRERPRMEKKVTQADLTQALKLAADLYDKDPGEGPVRIARRPPSWLSAPLRRTMQIADGEKKAQATLAATMDVDTDLQKAGLTTIFYRKRPQ